MRCRKMVSDMESNVTLILSDIDSEFEKIWNSISHTVAEITGTDGSHLKMALFYQGAVYEMKNELTRQKSLREKRND